MQTYTQKQITQVTTLARRGLTRGEIAQRTGMNKYSVTYYMKKPTQVSSRSQINKKSQTEPTINKTTAASTNKASKRTVITTNDSDVMKTIVTGLSRLFQDVERKFKPRKW